MNLRDLLFRPAELRAGETKMIDGRIALCINPNSYRGPLWAIKNRCAMFTVDGHDGYIEGLCRDVTPDKRLLSVEIIRGPFPIGTLLEISIDDIRRYFNLEDEDDERLKKVLDECTTSGNSVALLNTPSFLEMREARENERRAQDESTLAGLLGGSTYQWLKNVTCVYNEILTAVHTSSSRSLEKQRPKLDKQVEKLKVLIANQPLQNQ